MTHNNGIQPEGYVTPPAPSPQVGGIGNAHADLCRAISGAVGGWNPETKSITHVADVLLAAGYVKPRQVTTVEELDALPGGVVIRSAAGVIYVKEYEMFEPGTWWWVTAGAVGEFPTSRIARPATVLYVGSL